jgi:hypothetical protein
MRFVTTVSGGLIGGIAGYFIGVLIGFDWLIPNSNLSRIYGVFVTGPLGLIGGIIAGWLFLRPHAAHIARYWTS